jgi:hypothetical protein
MSRIFLSHSRLDSRAALALKQWLSEQRPQLANEIFLDIDPVTGLTLGDRWKPQLFKNNSRCEVVICLLSRNWGASHECKTEYRVAEGWGKRILCARLEDFTDKDITTEWQRCDFFAEGAQTEIAVPGGPPLRFNATALDQLRRAIEGTGVGPENFVWPPEEDKRRAPYRGWAPFEDIDAGVFFGRDAAIVRGLDELRGMRRDGLKSLFVILGPSGSGKSSFLRAGLLPRLRREDRQFVPLGIVRPARNALTGDDGLAAAIHSGQEALKIPGPSLGELKAICTADRARLRALLNEVREVAAARLVDLGQEGSAPTLVLPVDQAEELFSADARETTDFLQAVTELLEEMNSVDVGLIVAATIRTDRYEMMQNHPALAGVNTLLFDHLKPMPATQFHEVITGPAARTVEADQRLSISPDLIDRLLADAEKGADTLPLLSLTLARLYKDFGSTGELTLTEYELMGGMPNIVNTEIDEILSPDALQRSTELGLLRSTFPWLVTINADQQLRHLARFSELPEDSHPLIDALVAKRLMVKDIRDGHLVVEVALESMLRQWGELADWLEAHRRDLQTADDLLRNVTAWETNDHDPTWLLTGTRLTAAEMLAATPEFRQRLAATGEYLNVCQQAEMWRLLRAEGLSEDEGGRVRIIMSFATEDTRAAVALKKWLGRQDPQLKNAILLGVDVETGIRTGERWKDALLQADQRDEVVICLVSANWEASTECVTEYRTAEDLDKRILCARIAPDAGLDTIREWQRVDLFGEDPKTAIDIGVGPPVEFVTAGLAQLYDGVCGAAADTQSFEWPPRQELDRSPYRGWEPLEDIDAGVFFGRDAAIVRGLDELRGMRRGGSTSLLAVLGPVGCGKSSFLRAGLLPRLRRNDRNFVTLDIVRPRRDVITGETGLARAIYSTRSRVGLTTPRLGEIKEACRGDSAGVGALLRETHQAAAAHLLDVGPEVAPPTLVLPLDQAEELFFADAGSEAEQFLALLQDLSTDANGPEPGLIVAATIRTDRYEMIQTHPALAGVIIVPFEVKPMRASELHDVITSPAARASRDDPVRIAPDLITCLLADAREGANALPLLSLTLARLFDDYGATNDLTLAQYQHMGGMREVLRSVIESVLSDDPVVRGRQLQSLRAAFIPWLVTISSDDGQPIRRRARWSELPEDSHPLIDALVAKHLMVKDIRDGHVVVEVAQEIMLHQWDELAGWLPDLRQGIKTVDDVERNAYEWNTHDHDPAWLLIGTRLAAAESVATRVGFDQLLSDSRDYLSTCRQAEDHRAALEQAWAHPRWRRRRG